MKKISLFFLMVFLVFSCKEKVTKDTELLETTVKTDSSEAWEVLFDGSNMDQWTAYSKKTTSLHWKLEDGAMVFYPPSKDENPEGKSFNLLTKSEYTDFILSLEWKISKGGNSGIFWGVKEIPTLIEAYQTGPEIQILDNQRHPDAKAGNTHQAGALYDLVPPSKDVTKPAGEWNSCVVMVNHKTNKGSVVLNGVTITEFPVNNPEWGAMVAKSKFATWPHFGKYTKGKIGLQDHRDMVSYRNIKIQKL